jgi:hypothetical protein
MSAHEALKHITRSPWPADIERSEREGQAALVADSTALPIDLHYPDTESDLVALGFTLGSPIDNLFREATLPAGWQKRASDHAMWSYIDDDQGRERVVVFYKAAFYDRRAHMRLINLAEEVAS